MFRSGNILLAIITFSLTNRNPIGVDPPNIPAGGWSKGPLVTYAGPWRRHERCPGHAMAGTSLASLSRPPHAGWFISAALNNCPILLYGHRSEGGPANRRTAIPPYAHSLPPTPATRLRHNYACRQGNHAPEGARRTVQRTSNNRMLGDIFYCSIRHKGQLDRCAPRYCFNGIEKFKYGLTKIFERCSDIWTDKAYNIERALLLTQIYINFVRVSSLFW